MRARLATAEWPQYLPWVLLGLRVARKEDRGISLEEMDYGTQLALPAQLTAEVELPLAAILQSLGTAEPIPTHHQALPTLVEPTDPWAMRSLCM